MKSDQQLEQSLVNGLSTTHQFYYFLENQVDDLDRIVQTTAELNHPFAEPCRSARRLMMVHMGIVLILRVLEADRTVYVQNGLKWRVFDWVNEEHILCKESVEKARQLLRMMRPFVPDTFQSFGEVVNSDSKSEEENSSDRSPILGAIAGDYIRETSSEEIISDANTLSDERRHPPSSESERSDEHVSENSDDHESENSDDHESENSDDHESEGSDNHESESSNDHESEGSDNHESEGSDNHESEGSDNGDSEENIELIADYPC